MAGEKAAAQSAEVASALTISADEPLRQRVGFCHLGGFSVGKPPSWRFTGATPRPSHSRLERFGTTQRGKLLAFRRTIFRSAGASAVRKNAYQAFLLGSKFELPRLFGGTAQILRRHLQHKKTHPEGCVCAGGATQI